MMLTELCHELNNYFERSKYIGKFEIKDGVITSLDDGNMGLLDGQYFRVIGSVFNDGVHQYPPEDLKDESFDGAVWTMAVPPEFLTLAEDIDKWQAMYGAVDSEAMSPFTSESFGGYSYSKSGGGTSDSTSNAGTWQGTFASRLNKWRKIR